MHELLKGFSIAIECHVDWGDMDSFRHVNNTVYFRYFENARIEYGAKMGLHNRMSTDHIGPILSWTECRFLRPLVFPDTAIVGIRTISFEGSEMLMEYNIVSAAQNVLAAVGKSLGVYYDYKNLHRLDFPPELIDIAEAIEGRPIPRKHAAVSK
jgi:acyl-CoA thioester hydrolase